MALAAAWARAEAPPASSFTGTFDTDSDEREFFFTLASAGTVGIRTFSYAGGVNGVGATVPAGGFDPSLSIYDSNGTLLLVNQDGGCALVGKDVVTSSCWDAYISASLPAGVYRVVLTQSVNLPAGPTLEDSFIYNSTNLFNGSNLTNNTAAPPFGGGPYFTQPPGNASPGFWDFFPNQRTARYALDITGATSTLAPSNGPATTLPSGMINVAYSPVTLLVQGGPGVPYVWKSPPSGLPPGLSLSPSGVLSGTPTSAGTYLFTAIATDGVQPLSQTVTITISGPFSISTVNLPGALAGQSYGPVQLTTSGGSNAVTWTATGLAGLTLSPGGVLSGTAPLVSFTFTATATDTVTGQTATTNYTVTVTTTIIPLHISGGGTLTEVSVGTAVTASISVTGGTPPYRYTASNLPAGFSFGDSTGTLSGIANVPGNFSFTVTVADSSGQSGSVPVSLAVLGFISGPPPPAATATPYRFVFGAAGGRGNYIFSSANLPTGFALTSAGVLSGTPASGSFTQFSVQVSDGVVTASIVVTLQIITTPAILSLSGGALANGQTQLSYAATLTATGGTGSYIWSLAGGSLPPGLSLAPMSGQITGIPSVAGTYTFSVQAQDISGSVVSATYTIVVASAALMLTSGNSLPNGIAGSPYPLQIFTLAGGIQPYTLSLLTGSLPPGLTFANGQISGTPTVEGLYPFTIKVTDSSGISSSISISILVHAAQPDLILSTTYLSFSLMTGATAAPAGENVTVRSSVVQQILNYTFTVTPPVPWIAVTGGNSTPGSLAVSLTKAALSLGPSPVPYTTTLAITCSAPSACAGATQNVSIALMVNATPAQLSLDNALLSASSTVADPTEIRLPLGIQNSGSGTIRIVSVTAADPWVTVTGAPASVASGAPVPITLSINPAGLPSGYNSSAVTVNSSAGSVTVPVALTISANPALTLSPPAAQFTMQAGGPLGPSTGTFQVSLDGPQPANWNAAVLPGAGFLSIGTPSGSSTRTNAGTVTYSIDQNVAAQLPPGTYYGTIRVTSSSAVNSPQDFQISLQILPSSSLPVPLPQPAGLLFSSGAVLSQTVVLNASSSPAVGYQASAKTTDGGGWLFVSPSTGIASSTAPGSSTVSVNSSGLPQGVYTGLVNYAFSAAAVRSVNVTLVVTGSTQTFVCSPTKLVATQVGLLSNFSLLATLPAPLKVLVKDDCGNVVPNAQVAVSFSNGDTALNLSAIDSVSGIYSGAWVPLVVTSQATVSSVATIAGLSSGTSSANGQVSQYSGPVLMRNGVMNVFNPLVGAATSPGAILEIFGFNLSAGPVPSSQVPLSTTLGGTSVTIGGILASLYYVSPTQLNVQAPFELVPGNRYQVIVNTNGAPTAPGTISIAAAVPGVAGSPNGQIIAQHADGTLISQTSPAHPGTYVVLYLAGLGLTDIPMIDGAGSPSAPLAHPIVAPVLRLNGVTIPYQFAGLTPGLVSLYQLNFLVPTDTLDGDMRLTVSQAGMASNSVILPVRR